MMAFSAGIPNGGLALFRLGGVYIVTIDLSRGWQILRYLYVDLLGLPEHVRATLRA